MKTLAATLLIALSALTSIAADAPSASAKPPANPDAFVGRWRWSDASMVTVSPDGTAVTDDGRRPKATWKCIAATTPPKYEIRWGDVWIDTIYIVKNGKELKGTNKQGKKISAYRVEGPK